MQCYCSLALSHWYIIYILPWSRKHQAFPEWKAAIYHPLTYIGWSFSPMIASHPAYSCPFSTKTAWREESYCHIGSPRGTPIDWADTLSFQNILSKWKDFIVFYCQRSYWKLQSWQYDVYTVMLTHWLLGDFNKILENNFQVNFSAWWLWYLKQTCPQMNNTGP